MGNSAVAGVRIYRYYLQPTDRGHARIDVAVLVPTDERRS